MREFRWLRLFPRLLATGSLTLGLLMGGATPSPAGDPPAPPGNSTVILISLDGTRPEDVGPQSMPSLDAFARRGARARRLVASTPTNTFPNHVTLVTGVEPQRHGLVNNVFRDPERGVFDKQEIHGWIEVEPLWSLLEGAGIATAVFHWVGSEGKVPGGRAPGRFRLFSGRTTAKVKVDQILAWLDPKSEGQRPRFICSWMHGADHAGHVYGPGSPEVHERLRQQDKALGRLIEGIGELGLWHETTLLFVSDHGMSSHSAEVDVGAVLEAAGLSAQVYGIGGFASVVVEAPPAAKPPAVARAVAVLRAAGLDALVRAEAPPDAKVGHPRFGDVVVRAPLGTAIVHPGLELEGFHGYPPESQDMAAILIAGGRGVGPALDLGVVHGLDVAPTILALLGQPIPSRMRGQPIAAIVAGDGASATLSPPDGPIDGPDHSDSDSEAIR